MEDLAMSGFAEWARQWILLSRRNEYTGDGRHNLWMTVGGSAGHSGCYAPDIVEGIHSEFGEGRRWDVACQTASDAVDADKARKAVAKQADRRADLLAAMIAVPNGETKSVLRTSVIPQISPAVFDKLQVDLISEGIIELCEFKKHGRTESGYRLSPAASEVAVVDGR
ncbi:MAG: hypothetical protein ACI8P0_004531 [Planctomycetaceae bacterium]